jgi:hypothetical protein
MRRSAGLVLGPRFAATGRRGSVQGVTTFLLLILVGVLLYFLARTQVDEPITWLVRRLQTALGM